MLVSSLSLGPHQNNDKSQNMQLANCELQEKPINKTCNKCCNTCTMRSARLSLAGLLASFIIVVMGVLGSSGWNWRTNVTVVFALILYILKAN